MPPAAATPIMRYNGQTARDAFTRPLQTHRKSAFYPSLLAFRQFVGDGLDRSGRFTVIAIIKKYHPVGAGHAPPATVCYNEYNGLACRGGIYAARAILPPMQPAG